MDKYYNWDNVLSRDMMLNIVIGGRSIGKTYGIRCRAWDDFIRHNYRFVEVCRHKNEVPQVATGYHDKLVANGYHNIEDYEFKLSKGMYYYTRIRTDDETDKEAQNPWQLCGYFCALSDTGRLKKTTFANVRKVIFDEAIIDRRVSPYAYYFPNEYSILLNLLTTIAREEPGKTTLTRVYMLANACDIINPYFEALGINTVPKPGITCYRKRGILIDMVNSVDMQDREDESYIARIMDAADRHLTYSSEFDTSNIKTGNPPDYAHEWLYIVHGRRVYRLVRGLLTRAPTVWVSKCKMTSINPRLTYYIATPGTRDGMFDTYTVRKLLRNMYLYDAYRFDNVITGKLFLDTLTAGNII